MPRRRKRHVSKPALSFMESPVAVYNESVTHLHCADEPTTADVVTLDENLTVQWVRFLLNLCDAWTVYVIYTVSSK